MYCAPPRRQNRSTILLPSQICLKSHRLNCDSANPWAKRSAQRITISTGKRTFATEINLFIYENVDLAPESMHLFRKINIWHRNQRIPFGKSINFATPSRAL